VDLYDYERPYITHADMATYLATDRDTSSQYGRTVKATELSNVEYKIRFERLARSNNMKEPPSCGRIFMGFLVVRRMGTKHQYETWMPDLAFEEVYEPAV
jgi:alkylation response protein AidB-like acyl-CoA dehydrogenase